MRFWDRHGESALHESVELFNAADEIQSLLQKGEPVDSISASQWVTPLMKSAWMGRKEAVQLLINSGADVFKKTKDGATAMSAAAGGAYHPGQRLALGYEGYFDARKQIASMIQDAGVRDARLNELDTFSAAQFGLVQRLQACIAAGTAINEKDSNGRTALSWSAECGQYDAVKWLLDAGASLDTDDCGWGPLHFAAESGHVDVARLLIQSGADANARVIHAAGGQYGSGLSAAAEESPLTIAVYCCHAGMVELLANSGADSQSVKAAFALSSETSQPIAAILKTKTAEYAPPVADQISKEKPEIRNLLQQLQAILGEPRVSSRCRGAYEFDFAHVPNLNLWQLQQQVFASRSLLVKGHSDGNEVLIFYPTSDKYQIIKTTGTNGDNYGVTTSKVVAWLKKLETTQPFTLTECYFDGLAIRLLAPPVDPEKLAHEICKFCPDTLSLQAGNIEAIVADLRQNPSVFFWWD